MTEVDDALAELRAHEAMFSDYEQIVRSGLYDPDNGDPTFDPSHFDDGLDPDNPAPADDLFDPENFVSDYDGHECELGAACPYGPDGEYRDDPPDDDEPEPGDEDEPDEPDDDLDAARIVI